MKHILLFLLLFTVLLYAEEPDELILSTPQQIASLAYESDTLIGGLISPLSGMPILRVTDLIVQGAQPITLSRTYFSPYMPVEFSHEKQHAGEYEKKHLHAYLAKHYKGWQYLPHLLLEYFPSRRQVRVAPEADVPHTELGTKDGTKGKYPQAREFDAQGRPVRDIDFTDHGRPQNHPNPHEHKWKPNPTGGTPQRSTEAEPLTK